ncbi:MAG: gliding motility-associated ABC transporter substrate-binding protein GldG [Flavobacteriales bacterium]|nr:gliding motility-associated ABC transporter substrate-binding protein GldG [Flavobacteriales bacterium]
MAWKDIIQTVIIIAIIAVLNLIGFLQYVRIDLTDEGKHSLTPGFTELLQNDMDHNMYITVYLAGDDFPAHIENLRRNVQDKLAAFNRISGGMVKFEFIDPDEDEELAPELFKQLEAAGLSAKKVREQSEGSVSEIYFWPGATIEYGTDKSVAVQFISGGIQLVDKFTLNMASDQLEYKFLQAFRKLTRKTYPHVGILEGHGELPLYNTISIRGHLKESYNVDQVSLRDSNNNEMVYALADYQSVIIAQPKSEFSDKEKFILDQFIMNGGKVAWLIDPLNMNEDSLFRTGQTIALPYELNISDQLFNYGARINNEMIISEKCAPIYDFRNNQPADWNFYVLARNNNRDPVASNLNPVKLKYASPVEPVGDTSIVKRVLLESSPHSKVFKNPARVSLAYLDPAYQPNYVGESVHQRPTALILEGSFKSFYRNSLDPTYKNNPDVKFKDSSEFNKMLVIGDGDIIKNVVRRNAGVNKVINPETDVLSPDIEFVTMGQPYPAYGNTDFFKNAFDDLMEQDNLIALRGREFKQRPLNDQFIFDKGVKSTIKFLNVALPIILLLLFGGLQYLLRRRKFAKK